MRLTAHLCTHSHNYSQYCGQADPQQVVKSGEGGSTGAAAVHGCFKREARPVYGCFRFVTGALAAVKGMKAAKAAVERPFRDTKRAAAT